MKVVKNLFEEINLPRMQPGSSIMPGRVNPVIPEVVNQIALQVIGMDLTVTLASEAGQLQLNVMEPVIADDLFTMLKMLSRGCLIESFAKLLQLSISPVVLISAMGLLLLSLTNRLARIIDRIRELANDIQRSRDKNIKKLQFELKGDAYEMVGLVF